MDDLITHSQHDKKQKKAMGISSHPLWVEVEPDFYICPMLHVEMGIVNKLYRILIDYVDKHVQNVSKRELELQILEVKEDEKLKAIQDELHDFDCKYFLQMKRAKLEWKKIKI